MTDTDRASDKRVLPHVLHAEWQELERQARIRARLARIDAEIARLKGADDGR